MTSASSMAFFTASMAWSRLMMLPRRVPFIGEVPLPMISSRPRSLISPTSTHTFEVPMSRATMYLSSVLAMTVLLVGDLRRRGDRRRRGRGRDRVNGFDDDAVAEAEVGVFDAVRSELLGTGDGVKVAPLRGEVRSVREDQRAELAVEEREAARRDGANL